MTIEKNDTSAGCRYVFCFEDKKDRESFFAAAASDIEMLQKYGDLLDEREDFYNTSQRMSRLLKVLEDRAAEDEAGINAFYFQSEMTLFLKVRDQMNSLMKLLVERYGKEGIHTNEKKNCKTNTHGDRRRSRDPAGSRGRGTGTGRRMAVDHHHSRQREKGL